MKYKIIGILTLSILFTACSSDDISGSGIATTEIRELNAFTAVSLDGIAKVNITQGATQSVKITADDNIIGLLKTEIEDGVLEVYLASGHNYKNIDVDVEISAKGLNGVSNKGSGTVDISNVENLDFYLKNLGSGEIFFSGASQTLNIENEGSGRISGFSFSSNTCTVDILGSGDVEVNCIDELNVTIDGSAKVFYKGSPIITEEIEGSGKVIESN